MAETPERGPSSADVPGAGTPLAVVVDTVVGDELWRRARRARPREACGFLVGRRVGDRFRVSRVVPAVNRASRPDRFEIAAEDVWTARQGARRAGEELLGVYHSHPDGSAEPSPTDRAEAWGGWLHLIVPCGPADGRRGDDRAGGSGERRLACWMWRDGDPLAVDLEVEGDDGAIGAGADRDPGERTAARQRGERGGARGGGGSPQEDRDAAGCRICVSVAAAELSCALSSSMAGEADLLEVRLDLHDDPGSFDARDLARIVEDSPLPVIFTCRPAWEGGGFNGSEAARRLLLERASLAGAAFVDVEQDAEWGADFLADSPAPVVWSHHWDEPRPGDVDERVERFAGRGAAVVKLVAPADSPDDALPLLRAGARMVERGQGATAFCTGAAGRASRLLVATYGAAFTYATGSGATTVAEGQWPADRLRDELRWDRWRRDRICCGLVGDPIAQSLSPRLFNAAFAAAGAPYVYLPVPHSELGPALDLAEAWGFRGLSVTMPFKGQAVERCIRVDEAARAMGAVNTLVRTSMGWEGHNTDGEAVVESLGGAEALEGRRVVVLGAGGAARAAVVALYRAGAEIAVLNRTVSRAREVAGLVDGSAGPLEELATMEADVVVNATPVGMAGEAPGETPVAPDSLRGEEVVLDMVYRPPRTPLLRSAARRGCRTIGGEEMFVRQAAGQYRKWVGREPDLDVMRGAVRAGLRADFASEHDERGRSPSAGA